MYEEDQIEALKARIKFLEQELKDLKIEYLKLNLENSELRSYISTRFNMPKGLSWSTRKPKGE